MAGTVDVTATTYDDTSTTSSADQYTYFAAPTITSLSQVQDSTSGGCTITALGTGFTGMTGVTFGGVAAAGFTVLSDTQVTFVDPAHASGSVTGVLTTPGGTASFGFNYV